MRNYDDIGYVINEEMFVEYGLTDEQAKTIIEEHYADLLFTLDEALYGFLRRRGMDIPIV